MLLHIGNDTVIPKNDLVAVLAYDTAASSATRSFLRSMRSDGRLIVLTEQGKERSIVITTERIYVTGISCQALKRRAESVLPED
ncbi:uncharacterized protein DUF370 [Thermodesulfitimonas autotrophica]|uniref:Uncharacterized protein DUF370 n=1 Tax=Thermodesulfitimonas autotrophica TaxID=1894989 RepID=A0A3N5AQN1_9THEO|nr:extracellular matrix/biofilm biosynthesis regulator RemA family protein [Thermodesulfitimonas autotrophica]RPF47167.1 uncharacterized protein DUF370 [Thermodesulfitimonas autotrophica]